MNNITSRRLSQTVLVCTSMLLAAPPVWAAEQQSEAKARVQRQIEPITAGSEITVNGTGFVAGSKINIKFNAGTNLTAGQPFTVGADGTFSGKVLLPAGAEVGRHILNVLGSERQMAEARLTIYNAPKLALSGENLYSMSQNKLEEGLYQVAYSAKHNVLWATSSAGRNATPSYLMKIDPNTLEVLQKYNVNDLNPAPEGSRGNGAYGIAVDDVNDTIWTTNTRTDSVSAYSQADGHLIYHAIYPKSHPREVLVDTEAGKVYVANVSSGDVSVIDTANYATQRIPISAEKGARASNLALDPKTRRLYVSDLGLNNAVVIDTRTMQVVATYPLGVSGATGMAIDPALNQGYVASQHSAELTAFDLGTGAIKYRTPTGAGALSVEVDPDNHNVYVSNRSSGTVTVLDGMSGKVKANIATAVYPNHEVLVDGVLYALNKGREGDMSSDQITRLQPK